MKDIAQIDVNDLIAKTKKGFASLNLGHIYTKRALTNLETWLSSDEYIDYRSQIEHLISNEYWDYLLDSFYQVIPFGTGGRRGEVGVGPNRINTWTIRASAQGHSQYLLKQYGDAAKSRGVVFAYDVRQFLGNTYLSDDVLNPVKNLTSKQLAAAAAEVYAANGIKVYLFDDVRTTPELSFAIRHLHAVAGDMFSASHNPPTHNGKKVFDEYGGQLIPPDDEALVVEVTKNVKIVKAIPYKQAVANNLIELIGSEIDEKYIEAATAVSLSNERNINIVYTALHGCGTTSVYRALKKLGFNVSLDKITSNPSGKFENVVFNIPNPEVSQSFDTTLKNLKNKQTDIVLSSDPDADRIGIMVKHQGSWVFVNGNEIAAILVAYVVQKRLKNFKGNEVIVKTTVTTNLITRICEKNDIQVVGDLLIGFKYIGEEMNKLEKSDQIEGFLMGCEESHGYLAGNYARDKDAITPAIWLAELAAELKKENKTLVDFLNEIYSKYGNYVNYLTEIRLLGAAGKEKIDTIQQSLRECPPHNFGRFKIEKFEDCQNRLPIVSDTDKYAKDILIFQMQPEGLAESIKVIIRPSGTEPKSKMYFEIGSKPTAEGSSDMTKQKLQAIMGELEQAVMQSCYKIIGVDFPKRGFLLFWQLPLDDKLKYFEVEAKIEQLKDVYDKKSRKIKLYELLSFLGSNPVEKVDKAFIAKHKCSVLSYLDLSD